MKHMIKEYTLKSKSIPRETKEIKDSRDAVEELLAIYDRDTLGLYESAYALFLNSSKKIKGFMKLSDGGMNHVIVDPRTLMMGALGSLSTAIVLSHNHPSGNPHPSEEDRILTKKIMAACKLMDISFIDHVIIAGDSRYYSFRDHGELTT